MVSPVVRHLELLYRRMCDSGATFLEFQIGPYEKIRLVRHTASQAHSKAGPDLIQAAKSAAIAADQIPAVLKVIAPLSGVFYLAPAPSAPAFVEEGALVKKGDVLCIIEAMKVLNEIKSPKEGRIISICAVNGKHVKKGDMLFVYGN